MLAALTVAGKVNVVAMLVIAAGAALQLLGGDTSTPAARSAAIFSLAGVGLVVAGRRLWGPVTGVVIPLFLLVSGLAVSAGRDNLNDPESGMVLVGVLVQYTGVIVALVAGLAALRERRARAQTD
ncbi:hypothetical protein [Phytoactinopolyspora endophytica]|uniref:hypothetical protein n=1 Tax=Phytoactinopolyspora endophytica TaxID=1642495 RepID=UPI00101DD233|nr:hypothetical protein [Phytoactinopolyspora endophytica]